MYGVLLCEVHEHRRGPRAQLVTALLLLVSLLLAAAPFSPIAHSQSVVATIPVGRGNDPQLVYDSGKGEVFVFNDNDSTVSVISDATNTVVATVAVATVPPQSGGVSRPILAYDSSEGEVFAANGESSNNPQMSIISDATNTVVAVVPMGANFNSLVYDSGKGELFVAYPGNPGFQGGVLVYSTATWNLVATVKMGPMKEVSFPEQTPMAYDSGKGEVFVVNGTQVPNSTPNETVSVISDATNTVVATVKVAASGNNLGLAYDSGKGEVFVAGTYTDPVSVISDSTNTVVANVNVSITSPTGAGAGLSNAIAYDSARGELFVSAAEGSYFNGAGIAGIISDNNNTLVGTVAVGHHPLNIAYDSGKGEVFVDNQGDNTVSVVSDGSSGTTATTATTSATPTVTSPTTATSSGSTVPVKTINIPGVSNSNSPLNMDLLLLSYIAAPAAVVVIAGLAVFVLLRRRKKHNRVS